MTTQREVNPGPDTAQSNQPRNGRLILAFAVLASLALAGGCATQREARNSSAPIAYSETTVTQTPPEQPGSVVPDHDSDSVYRAPKSVGAADSPGGQFSGEASGFELDDLITDPATLVRGHDTANFEGRPVRFFALRVEQVLDGRLLLISENGRSMYATSRVQTPAICVGDIVTISGTIRRGDGSDSGLAAPVPQPPSAQPYYIETDKIVNGTK